MDRACGDRIPPVKQGACLDLQLLRIQMSVDAKLEILVFPAGAGKTPAAPAERAGVSRRAVMRENA